LRSLAAALKVPRTMDVCFKRTGARRYAVVVTQRDARPQVMDPAPGYDDDIPHDLVHYVVEAELGLMNGVFGRAAQGGGSFIGTAPQGLGRRERARLRRKQAKREKALRSQDGERGEMASSERLAALCDVAWRKRHGQRPDPLRSAPATAPPQDVARIERVLARLDELAPLWRALPVGGALVFVWPSASAEAQHARFRP
jgi:hypothetical protein